MAVYPYGPAKPRMRFSRTEIRHIILAVVVLTLAFAMVLAGGLPGIIANPTALIGTGILAAVAVPTAFLLHELGHKMVAQRYGLLAEFRAWTFGLALALFTAALRFLFAAPGAVVIGGVANQREYGRISVAGPLVNLALGGAFTLLLFVLRAGQINVPLAGTVTLVDLAFVVAFINLFLGVFNMLPIPPLDGSKVVRWDLRVYVGLLGSLVAILVFVLL